MLWWLTRSLADVPDGDAWLGASERAALSLLGIEKRRLDWTLGRYTAKVALCGWLGVDPWRVEVLAAPSGAPIAHLDGRRLDIAVSISHRAGRALAVVAAPAIAVGCDLELIEPRSAAFVREWLAPAEQTRVNDAPSDEQPGLANLFWSAKEAATKARGEGLRLEVRHAQVMLGEPDPGAEEWHPLHVDWGPESERDHGWYRTDASWVMTVIGGGPIPPLAWPARAPVSLAAVRT
ncbi:MAG: 4'-phosphopantetheinyl transferase superfamily protein [Solirubrobacteraceae bacterium]